MAENNRLECATKSDFEAMSDEIFTLFHIKKWK